MNASNVDPVAAHRLQLLSLLQAQKKSLLDERFPSADIRVDRLNRLIDVHLNFKDQIIEALTEDFNGRSKVQSLVADVVASVVSFKHTRDHVAQWMKPQKRKLPLIASLTGGRAEVHYQPLGVVGNISPWNFPVGLAFAPMAEALAAGNRVMLKPSELTPCASAVIKQMVESAFAPEEMVAITGGVEVAQAFSSLPFDHLVYTGGPEVAKHVMRAAAENLVPLTLELGGKCPVVVGEGADIAMAAERIMGAKAINAGQLCLSPDYVFVPRHKMAEFVACARANLTKFFPTVLDNDDVTSVVNERHWQRLNSYVDEAKAQGVRVETHNPNNESFDDSARHKMPFSLVIDPADDLKIMQDEVFGPLIEFDLPINFINQRERPLALYYFGKDKAQVARLLKETTSGGVTVNDVAQHVAFPDLPLGGVGNSGMGAYHGHTGFKRFSHEKAVYKQGLFSMAKFLQPPFTDKSKKLFEGQLKR